MHVYYLRDKEKYAEEYAARDPVVQKAKAGQYYRGNRGSYWEGNLRRKFGISVAEYEAMEAEQGGLCGVCDRPPTRGRKLDVDHDHDVPKDEQGRVKVRGLLCSPCNLAAHRPKAWHLRMVAYLEKNETSGPTG